MNYIYNKVRLALLIAPLLLTSCDDWFDVRPKSQIKEGDLYSTESGFQDATLGIYTLMGSEEAYGGNMTMGFLDVLAQQYTSVKDPLTTAMSYSYTDTDCKSIIAAMWEKCYNAIANCNYLIKNVDESDGVLSESMRRIVKAEALAARAYLHFDMMRLYAPSYAAGRDVAGVPYMQEPTVNPQNSITVGEMCSKLVADLVTAREMIRDVDPICQTGYSERLDYDLEDYLADNGFLLYRTSRMNYYGITALLARICLYMEDNASALNYAKEVIDSGKFDLINDALIADDADETYATTYTYTFMQSVAKHEYISSVYVYNLKEGLSDLYFRDSESASLQISDIRKTQVFGADGLDYDIRAKRMFSVPSGSTNEYVNKYMTGTQIPLLKIGEMYLIAAEASGDVTYLETMRQKRGYPHVDIAEGELQSELQREYQREFIAEGQLFFYYKRMNLSQIPNTTVPATDAIYVLSKPDEELEFGN